ncbi:hypothetical protein EDB85DRAFT_1886698 [Lactarius pseudohatsudake]|nr:hypothetical protein EDB85DRAFT_1886698 [Lactarius pseudohatsudake]
MDPGPGPHAADPKSQVQGAVVRVGRRFSDVITWTAVRSGLTNRVLVAGNTTHDVTLTIARNNFLAGNSNWESAPTRKISEGTAQLFSAHGARRFVITLTWQASRFWKSSDTPSPWYHITEHNKAVPVLAAIKANTALPLGQQEGRPWERRQLKAPAGMRDAPRFSDGKTTRNNCAPGVVPCFLPVTMLLHAVFFRSASVRSSVTMTSGHPEVKKRGSSINPAPAFSWSLGGRNHGLGSRYAPTVELKSPRVVQDNGASGITSA